MGHRVAFSHYVSALNEIVNDKYLSIIGELDPKDRYNRWENFSSLSPTPQFLMEPMWDCIIAHP